MANEVKAEEIKYLKSVETGVVYPAWPQLVRRMHTKREFVPVDGPDGKTRFKIPEVPEEIKQEQTLTRNEACFEQMENMDRKAAVIAFAEETWGLDIMDDVEGMNLADMRAYVRDAVESGGL